MDQNLEDILQKLRNVVKVGKPAYDKMAANIKRRAAEGIIEEGLGYIPVILERSEPIVGLRPNFKRSEK